MSSNSSKRNNGEVHEEEEEEPMTPAGRFFLQPEMDQVINVAVGFKNPINLCSIKAHIKNSVMIQHPRFRSLFVKDRNGKERWKKLREDEELNLDKHVIERLANPEEEDEEVDRTVNAYLADLAVSSPLETDKPLWEVHVLTVQRCAVLRLHHSLGDGISLMSLFLLCCQRVDAPDELPTIRSSSSTKATDDHNRSNNNRRSLISCLWGLAMAVWWTLIYVIKFGVRGLWVKDTKTSISGGPGVEMWPRMLATAKFSFDDMKAVKNSIKNCTINDVLFGVITSGLSRYLDLQSSNKKPAEGLQMTGLAMVNLRPTPGLQELSNLMKRGSKSRWGNQFGYMLLPINYQNDLIDPLQCVRRAKVMLNRKKQSLEAYFTYKIGHFILTYLGPKAAFLLNYRVVCNTSFTISNVVGPQEEIMFDGNPITYIRANSSSLAHAITMHMVSYAGKAKMQILVAKDIIHDPRVLAKCFEDALLEMKEAVTNTKTQKGTVSDSCIQHS